MSLFDDFYEGMFDLNGDGKVTFDEEFNVMFMANQAKKASKGKGGFDEFKDFNEFDNFNELDGFDELDVDSDSFNSYTPNFSTQNKKSHKGFWIFCIVIVLLQIAVSCSK